MHEGKKITSQFHLLQKQQKSRLHSEAVSISPFIEIGFSMCINTPVVIDGGVN